MVRREAVALGMLMEIGEAQRLRLDDQQAQDAVALRVVADGRLHLGREPDWDELRQSLALLVEDTQRRVARPGQRPRRLGDATEYGPQIQLRLDREEGVEELTQGFGVVDLPK